MLTILEKDRELVHNLPVYTVVGASAGTGKTRALKQRFIQLLLSKSIPNNKPENILAITFTNNAAREMKQRVLGALKSASLGDPDTLKELHAILSQGKSELQLQAGIMVDAILDDYSAFQILTIDSFLARVFKASALELGLSPDLEIVLDSDALLDEAFSLFARELSEGTDSARLLKELLYLLSESQRADDRFVWNPHPYLGEKVKDLYKKIVLTSSVLKREEYTDEIHECSEQFMRQVLKLDTLTTREGLLKTDRFEKLVALANAGDIDSLLRLQIPSPPVKKTGSNPAVYRKAVLATQSLTEELNALKQRLILLKARQHYQPYADALTLLAQSTETVKRERGQVDIGDVVKRLAEYLRPGVVPEIYYSLGESLCHYLIDEFQDTNPIQWDTLVPLIENALSTKGSLFVVGDTKQSIYGFRGADWKIMKRLQQEDVFPSARKDLKTLTINFRSFGRILGFNTAVFQSIIPHKVIEAAATASGLATDQQLANKDFADKGYVELTTIPAEDTSDSGDLPPQKQKLLDIVKDCVARGYRHSDITILSPRNDDIIEVSGWLNGKNIPFISHSSLDVRRRRVTGELLALLRFLDSPIDDLSFTTFLLGSIFDKLLQRTGSHIGPRQLQDFLFKHREIHRRETPLYVSFRQTHPGLWKVIFEELYTVVGYLPVYDLISEIYRRFCLFAALPDEEATLVKILEVVKDFEGRGENSLKAFLQYAQESSEDADWDISIPSDVDAVRVMTIHKAKGLESEVTIVLLYDSSPRRDGLYLEDDREQVRLVHVTKDNAAGVPELQKLYQKKELAQVVDDLNKLYVALTRAEEEMYILSVKSRRAKAPSEFFPESGYEPQPKPIVERREPKSRTVVTLSYDIPHVTTRPVEYDAIPLRETKRGEFIHAVLEQIEYADDHLDNRLREAIKRASILMPLKIETQAVYDLLFTAINLPDLLTYFTRRPGRQVLNEQEFVTPVGSLTRMDRVVIDTDSVTVLDYKTGDEKADYVKQVSNYMETLRDLFKSRSVHGLLVYLDRKTVRAIP